MSSGAATRRMAKLRCAAGDLGIAVPDRRLHRVVEALAVCGLDVGEILAHRQDLVVEQLQAARHVVVEVVAVGGLRRVDVPVGRRIAIAHDLQHLVERGGDDRAAGLGAAEERLLVDLGRRAGVADEDDVHLAVVARQEHVQQHEEALGQVLQRLGHGGRRIHQAEHDRLGGGLRHPLEAVVGQVDRIDVGDGAAQPLLVLEPLAQLGDLGRIGGVLRLGGGKLLLQLLDLGLARPPQRHAPAQALAHGAGAVEAGRRAVAGVAGARQLRRLQVLEPDLDEVGQLEVVEEQVEELFLGEREGELVLALAVGTALAAAPAPAALGLGDLVADLVFLVARQHVVALAGVAAKREGGLAQALRADRDLLRALGLRDLARLERVLDGLADLRLGAAQEALAIAEALGLSD